MSTLESALGISAISIVLLFAAMAVIWGLMALMARIPNKKATEPEAAEETGAEAQETVVVAQEAKAEKSKAAAAAVAVALALRKAKVRLAPNVSGSVSTSWQSAQRADHISRRNQIISRK